MKTSLFSIIIVIVNSCESYYIMGYGVNQTEQKFIVEKHNAIRMLVANGKVKGQPRGVNLKRMHWDDYLAKYAQIFSGYCKYGYRKFNDGRFYAVGQNIHLVVVKANYPSLEADWDSTIEAWFMQRKNYTYPEAATDQNYNTHYTQLVWAQTNHVGCGFTMYKRLLRTLIHYKFYFCFYGPSANYYGHSPYETGTSGGENLL